MEEVAGDKIEKVPGAALAPHLHSMVAQLRQNLNGPLEYIVLHSPLVRIRAEPSTLAEVVGKLKHNSVVRGFPAGKWLFIEKEEVERMRGTRKNLAPTPAHGGWVLIDPDGLHLGKGRLLAPQWAQITLERFYNNSGAVLSWPGIEQDGVCYLVQWRSVLSQEQKEHMTVADDAEWTASEGTSTFEQRVFQNTATLFGNEFAQQNAELHFRVKAILPPRSAEPGSDSTRGASLMSAWAAAATLEPEPSLREDSRLMLQDRPKENSPGGKGQIQERSLAVATESEAKCASTDEGLQECEDLQDFHTAQNSCDQHKEEECEGEVLLSQVGIRDSRETGAAMKHESIEQDLQDLQNGRRDEGLQEEGELRTTQCWADGTNEGSKDVDLLVQTKKEAQEAANGEEGTTKNELVHDIGSGSCDIFQDAQVKDTGMLSDSAATVRMPSLESAPVAFSELGDNGAVAMISSEAKGSVPMEILVQKICRAPTPNRNSVLELAACKDSEGVEKAPTKLLNPWGTPWGAGFSSNLPSSASQRSKTKGVRRSFGGERPREEEKEEETERQKELRVRRKSFGGDRPRDEKKEKEEARPMWKRPEAASEQCSPSPAQKVTLEAATCMSSSCVQDEPSSPLPTQVPLVEATGLRLSGIAEGSDERCAEDAKTDLPVPQEQDDDCDEERAGQEFASPVRQRREGGADHFSSPPQKEQRVTLEVATCVSSSCAQDAPFSLLPTETSLVQATELSLSKITKAPGQCCAEGAKTEVHAAEPSPEPSTGFSPSSMFASVSASTRCEVARERRLARQASSTAMVPHAVAAATFQRWGGVVVIPDAASLWQEDVLEKCLRALGGRLVRTADWPMEEFGGPWLWTAKGIEVGDLPGRPSESAPFTEAQYAMWKKLDPACPSQVFVLADMGYIRFSTHEPATTASGEPFLYLQSLAAPGTVVAEDALPFGINPEGSAAINKAGALRHGRVAEACGIIAAIIELLEDADIQRQVAALDASRGGPLATWLHRPPWQRQGIENLAPANLAHVPSSSVVAWARSLADTVASLASPACGMERADWVIAAAAAAAPRAMSAKGDRPLGAASSRLAARLAARRSGAETAAGSAAGTARGHRRASCPPHAVGAEAVTQADELSLELPQVAAELRGAMRSSPLRHGCRGSRSPEGIAPPEHQPIRMLQT